MYRLLQLVLGAAVLIAFSGCVHHPHYGSHGNRNAVVVHKPAPPPHAPAHGHRQSHHRHPDVELVFDSGLGLYMVVGFEDYFFHQDFFYRAIGDVWHRSARVDGGWVAIQHRHKLPPGLAKKHGKRHKPQKKHHRHPAKHGY